MTDHNVTERQSEKQKLADDESRRAMHEMREQADIHDPGERKGPGEFPGQPPADTGEARRDADRERYNENDVRREQDDDNEQGETKGPGEWPGQELTRNVVPNPDDGVEDDEAQKLPDDLQRDISRQGVMSDPEKRVSSAP